MKLVRLSGMASNEQLAGGDQNRSSIQPHPDGSQALFLRNETRA